ncbi:hypothetical protein ACFQ05_34375 [Amycolatopsis umgeniensis]|uniref:Uncharacterized protein n=1 Tax=Amycolatopsis umgeniensis TaxID=336628 RepID=A0A841BAR7_9PSEU|nr:hypothetical protein [Amycolatopsis umgeniensis]MBB5855963.1 hypothetical protein [Amycolatopsis umgeniensis]
MYIPPEPSAYPAKPRRWPWFLGTAIAVAALSTTLVLVLLGNERDGNPKPVSAAKSTSSPCKSPDLKPPCQGVNGWVLADGSYESTTRTTPPAYVAPTTTSPPPLTPADFTLEPKTYSKQCFGSAGCVVVVEPAVSYKGTADAMLSHGTCSMTYDITGDKSGTITDTLSFVGTSVTMHRSVLSTSSSKTKVAIKIVSVSCP